MEGVEGVEECHLECLYWWSTVLSPLQAPTLCWVSARGGVWADYHNSRLGLIDRDFQLFRIYIVMVCHKHIRYFQLRTWEYKIFTVPGALWNTLFIYCIIIDKIFSIFRNIFEKKQREREYK